MSVELQIRSNALGALTSRTVRQRLRHACFLPFGAFSIDHLEVVPGGDAVREVGSSVEVQLLVDVFVISDAALAAAPNGVPAGATSPTSRVLFVFRPQVALTPFKTPEGEARTRAVLTLVFVPPDLSPLAAIPGVNPALVTQQLSASVPAPSIDLTAQLQRLGMTTIETADVKLFDGVIGIRFNTTGAPVVRLFSGQDWGLFVDAPAVEQLVRAKVEPSVADNAPLPATVSAHYQAADTMPHVDLAVDMPIRFLIYHVSGTMDLPCDLSIVPGPPPLLRTTIDWSIHVDAGPLVPRFVESFAEGLLDDLVDPADFGGISTGDHTFVMDSALQPVTLPGVLFRYDNAFGSDAGMTIGGAVVLDGLYEPPFTMSVTKLGRPTRVQLCSQRARAGSGAPSSEPPTLENTRSFGEVVIEGCGVICGAEQRAPDGSFRQYLSVPAPGALLETATLRATVPYTVANVMTQPFTFVVRTPRGVRLVDFGMSPKVQPDATGSIVEARDLYIPDCLSMVPLKHGRFGAAWGQDVDVFKPWPLELPDWAVYLQSARGLIVQIVQATGLNAGELVRFRSATHAIDVVADHEGSALVPVLLSLSPAVQPALLDRADGRSLDGHVAVEVMMFERHLTLSGDLQAGLATTNTGGALVTTHSRRMTLRHTITVHGAVSRNMHRAPEVQAADRARELAEHAGIRGIDRVVAIPGRAESGLAVAIMADDTKLLLDMRGGSARICGTFAGPIGALEFASGWAVAALGGEVAVFHVTGPGYLAEGLTGSPCR